MPIDRTVVITGAAEGIGLGIASQFAKHGYRTAMLDVQADKLAAAADMLGGRGAQVMHHVADVSSRDQIEAAYAAVRERFGPIQVVVPNAGISNMLPFAQMPVDAWERMLSINLTGVFHTVQAAVGDMIAANWGRIVTISSQAAQSGSPMQAHYAAAKGGVIGMTKALARELASHGITVNTVPPSLVETPMMLKSVEEGTFPLERVVPMIPISRPGQPEEIGAACVFLASDEAAYITGQVLGVNGGMYM